MNFNIFNNKQAIYMFKDMNIWPIYEKYGQFKISLLKWNMSVTEIVPGKYFVIWKLVLDNCTLEISTWQFLPDN